MKVSCLLIKVTLLTIIAACMISMPYAQTRPPTITSTLPHGGQVGTTVTLTVEGTNLGKASEVLFDSEKITGKILNNIDLGPDKFERAPGSTAAPIEDRATKNQVGIEVTISPETKLGRHSFRLKTPLGSTNLSFFFVGGQPEVNEKEPNNTAETAQRVMLPVTLNGAIDMANDVDFYRFDAKPGQELVFEIVASSLGSALDSTLSLRDQKGNLLAQNDDFNGRADSVLAYRFPEAGSFTISVSDSINNGSKRHFYRLTMGELPFITTVFPLGVRKGTTAELSIEGYNLGGVKTIKVKAPDADFWGETIPLPVKLPKGEPINKLRIALGDYPEIIEREPNDELKSAQVIKVPATINGHIEKGKGGSDEDLFQFRARKGQQLSIEVMAQRVGSPLDSAIEVLDAKGNVVPRATARPLFQTFTTLRDHDSLSRGIRVDSYTDLQVGDYILIDNELLQVAELPKSPDDDLKLKDFQGKRIPFEDTSSEGHPLNSPVYKVELSSPGKKFPPNGMPIFQLSYRNDDGGPTYGKDSHLTFTAPEDSDYYVRIRDVRGLSGKLFAYRLTIAEPRPDFVLFVNPVNPNVPRSGSVPVTISAHRIGGFTGAIEVQIKDLPEGLQAPSGTILPENNSVVLPLSASDNAVLSGNVPLRVVGRSTINGREVHREPDREEDPVSVVSLTSSPDLYVATVDPGQIEIEPGGKAQVRVKIKRANGFAGRVPLSLRNVPFMLNVPDIGLNGILITENEDSRTFEIVADRRAEPLEQTLYVTGKVETNSTLPSDYASGPIKLKILPKSQSKTQQTQTTQIKN